MSEDFPPFIPKCVATTGSLYQCSIDETQRREVAASDGAVPASITKTDNLLDPVNESNYFKNALWSPDGTTILTSSADNKLRTFVIPPDLLSPHEDPVSLRSYHTRSTPEPTYSLAIHPSYDLSTPPSTLYVSSTPSHPISLHSALSSDLLSSYPLIHGPTETYLSAHSLIFDHQSPSTFLAGSTSMIALFSLDRPYSEPVLKIPTIPSTRNNLVGGGVGMKGIVSSLSISSSNMLAAGTFTRCIGLYDHKGSGSSIAVFGIPEDEDAGNGITTVQWDHQGRYLFVAERSADVVLIYDVRVTGKQLGSLRGRKANTNQRMDLDIVESACTEVWAGGTDGVVRVWKGPWLEEPVTPSYEWNASRCDEQSDSVDADPICSVGVHRSGMIVATCSGQRHLKDRFAEDESESEDGDIESSDEDHVSSVESRPAIYDNKLSIWRL